MVIDVKSNKDMPVCLNTETKQKRMARELAEARFKKSVKIARGPQFQGFFSRTMIVTFKDNSQIVIQFRPEPLDVTPFRVARQILGTVVPEIDEIENEDLRKDGISTYYMTMMDGVTWTAAAAGNRSIVLPTINKSIGEIFAKGYVQDNSTTVVEERLRPHLQLIVESELSHTKSFQKKAQDLLKRLDMLKVLPLWITHFDLNDMNILLDDTFNVSGIVDWELSFPQPFGVFLGRIHILAGEYSEGEHYEGSEFEVAERALWTALYEGLEKQTKLKTVYRNILDNPESVQLAVEVGTILDAFQLNGGQLIEESSPVVMRSLSKLLSYRIPILRGDARPYSG